MVWFGENKISYKRRPTALLYLIEEQIIANYGFLWPPPEQQLLMNNFEDF
jgi:hypothetical protein